MTNNTWTDSRSTLSKSVIKMYKARISHGVLISNPKYTVYEFRVGEQSSEDNIWTSVQESNRNTEKITQ